MDIDGRRTGENKNEDTTEQDQATRGFGKAAEGTAMGSHYEHEFSVTTKSVLF